MGAVKRSLMGNNVLEFPQNFFILLVFDVIDNDVV